LYLKTLKRLVLLSLLPTILIYFFAINIFTFVFGEKWALAGEFVEIMTPIFFLRFVSFPLSYMVYVVEKQSYNTIAQFILLLALLISFFIGKMYTPIIMVQILTVVFCTFYSGYIVISYNLTSRGIINNTK